VNEEPPVSSALAKLGIQHAVFRHSGEVTSLEQAAQERGQRPEQVIRSILFRLAADSFVIVLVAGPSQVSWQKLRRHVGQTRLSLASAEEVLRVTGYRIGTVSPFGLPRPIRTLVDRGVLLQTEVSIGSGVANTGVILKSADLFRGLEGAELVNLTD
jgi:Cys-tRNA(Pro)/Cys-tRNA(Cys) deacylase